MDAQIVVVALLVVACTSYAAWTLMPGSLRRRIAALLLKLPLPHRLAISMRKHSVQASGCACDGCDRSATSAAKQPDGVAAPIVFHARLRR
jgi:hypothetical protein